MRQRWARYGNGYSRSVNAECAEADGRLPRTRAAESLGLSVRAFDTGCAEARYTATEWHHVGRYASEIYYYDCNALADDPAFWKGALSVSSPVKRAAITARLQAAREKARDEWRQRMAAQRDTSVYIASRREATRLNWELHCQRVCCGLRLGLATPTPGDTATLTQQRECAQWLAITRRGILLLPPCQERDRAVAALDQLARQWVHGWARRLGRLTA